MCETFISLSAFKYLISLQINVQTSHALRTRLNCGKDDEEESPSIYIHNRDIYSRLYADNEFRGGRSLPDALEIL